MYKYKTASHAVVATQLYSFTAQRKHIVASE